VICPHSNLVGGFNPSEKYESQLGVTIPNIWENVPNHQPNMLYRVDDVVIYSIAGGKTSACTWLAYK
jgi:predicted ThiF/HesA family dinucleotide-utilizing enzyme